MNFLTKVRISKVKISFEISCDILVQGQDEREAADVAVCVLMWR